MTSRSDTFFEALSAASGLPCEPAPEGRMGVVTLSPELRLLACPAEGASLGASADALDLIGEAFGADTEWILIPSGRLSEGFYDLKTGLAGEFLQKLTNYRLKVAIVGDLETRLSRSEALSAFVRESNAGRAVWFLPGADALFERLRSAR